MYNLPVCLLQAPNGAQVMSAASLIATHMNVPYGKILTSQDIIASFKSGNFEAATEEGRSLLAWLFVEVQPGLILKCASEIQAPLENVNRLYQRTRELGLHRIPEWEYAVATLS